MSKRSGNFFVRFLTGLIVLVLLAGASIAIFEQYQDSQRVDGVALDRQAHDDLPLGTSVADVQGFLTQHNIGYSKNMTLGEIDATVWDVKGSNFLVRDDLGFAFRFDYRGKLVQIETKHYLTSL